MPLPIGLRSHNGEQGGIRTLTGKGLSLVPLPIGILARLNMVGDGGFEPPALRTGLQPAEFTILLKSPLWR